MLSSLDIRPMEETESPRTWRIRQTVKVLLLLPTCVLVLYYQANRSKVTHSYHTSDPRDNKRDGVTYTCGCSLPPQLQGPENPTKSATSSLNRCYDSSELETVNILMYSNFSGVKNLEQILQDAYSDKFPARKKKSSTAGFRGTQQGHYISWHNNTFLDNFKMLFPDTQHIRKTVISAEYLTTPEFLEFPSSFVGVALTFFCNNCTSCPLPKVRQLFEAATGTSNQTWGHCEYWGTSRMGNHCRSEDNSYMAKCVMYPTATEPLNFAVRSFVDSLFRMPDVDRIAPPQDSGALNQTSFDASVLYMNFSRVARGQVELNFFELQKSSAGWFQLLTMFPTMDTECKDLKNVRVCNGTSVCTLSKSAKVDEDVIKCFHMTNKSLCQLYVNANDTSFHVTIDNEKNLLDEFKVKSGDWSDLICMDYICQEAFPYSILWETEPAMRQDAFNWYLESRVLSNYWAQNSGVCTNTYTDVLRNEVDETTNFLEANCSYGSPSPKSASTTKVSGYCWLTGRYHRLADKPTDEWHTLQFPDSQDLFVCYHVTDQSSRAWFIVTFGVLFGWLGTIDLLYKWALFPLAKRFVQSLRSWVKRPYVEENGNGFEEGPESTQSKNDEGPEFENTQSMNDEGPEIAASSDGEGHDSTASRNGEGHQRTQSKNDDGPDFENIRSMNDEGPEIAASSNGEGDDSTASRNGEGRERTQNKNDEGFENTQTMNDEGPEIAGSSNGEGHDSTASRNGEGHERTPGQNDECPESQEQKMLMLSERSNQHDMPAGQTTMQN